ncbi:MAG: tetratricopeptide repeat protein [Deltaproteobacteria bacterium]|nr:tetratricopeptide repeat protein [Deltaproteobacteria bacterium]
MLPTVADFLWRSVLLLAQGFAPGLAPLEAAPSTAVGPAILRLALSVLLLGALGWGAVSARKSQKAVSRLLGLCVAAGIAGSAATSGAWAPLARAAWIVCPIVWITAGACVAAYLLPRLPLKDPALAGRRFVVPAAVVIALVSLWLARGRLSDKAELIRATLLRDPGNELAAIAAAADLRAKGRPDAACQMVQTCAGAPTHPCACTSEAVSCALDQGNHTQVLSLLEDSGHSCSWTATRVGMRAEALAGLGRLDEAAREIDSALKLDPKEPHALFARSRVAYLQGDAATSRSMAEAAVAAGHGLGGRLQYGMILFQAGDLAGARRQFEEAVRVAPDNVSACYDLALVSHKQGKYRDAREGYLRVLQLDPTYVDARYNLVLLTQSAGATDEARHHLEKLTAMAPKDPRLPGLQALLSNPAPPQARP